MKCDRCGTENPKGIKKCSICGNDLVEQEESSYSQEQNDNIPFAIPITEDEDQEESINNMAGVFKRNNRQSKLVSLLHIIKAWPLKRKGIIGGVVAAVLVIFILFATKVICFHDWQDATCTTAMTCEKCHRTKGEALGHKWTEATCTEPSECEICGRVRYEALGHDVSKWEITTKATCTEDGEQKGKCDRCGQIIKEKIVAPGHDWGDWNTAKEATCTEDGNEKRQCKVCKEEETQVISKQGHDWSDWKTTREVTFSSAGQKERTCSRCGITEKEDVPVSEDTVKQELNKHLLRPVKEFVAYCESQGFTVQYRVADYENRYSTKGYWEQNPPDGDPDPLPNYQTLLDWGYEEGGDPYADLTLTIWALKISSIDTAKKNVVVWINLNALDVETWLEDVESGDADKTIEIRLYEGGVEK